MPRLFLLFAAILLAACGPRSQTGARIDPGLEALIPPDTLHLVGARVEEIRDSPLYKMYDGQRQTAMLDEFGKRTGVDPRRDIAEVLAANDGKQTLMLVRGKFQPAAIEKKVTAEGAATLSHRGRTLLGNEHFATAFVSDTIAIGGPAALVRATLDRGNKPMPERLASLVRSLQGKAQVFAVSMGSLPALGVPQGSNFRNLERAFSGIDTALVSVDLSSGLRLSVDAKYATEADARQVHGAVRGLIGLGRLTTPPDKSELLRFYDAFVTGQEGVNLRVKADIAADLLDKVIRHLTSLADQALR
jgi:hypothetical protein